MAGLCESGNEPPSSLKAISAEEAGTAEFVKSELISVSSGRSVEEQLEEEQFDFRKGKGTTDAIGLLRTIAERYLEKNKAMYIVFVNLEKVFDSVDWNTLIGILKNIAVDWKERRLFSNLYMKRVKVRIGEEMSEVSEIVRGVRQGRPSSSVLFNIYLEDLVKNCFRNMGGVIVGGRRMKCIRFADDMALLAEEETICYWS
ncbi:hypothetical protein ANN_16300 [Periplaneta americana]|uniref:Reverse transcriptase domain-containing protein n=1 Tax=Periplaneta americana TaxID=6978 RepID=A0ABQ8SJJ8_PERAM|nr:hypothetical protein ANN_16300 [Periplaneta americana]